MAAAVVSGSDEAEMLEPVEAAFDAVPGLAGGGVARDVGSSRAARENDGGHAGSRNGLAQGLLS